ncbi:MAG TPA: helix-turn-helix domain-containing protein [Pseudonocardia sp.]|jgi:DNA-binding HxlR family transcriptional regulator
MPVVTHPRELDSSVCSIARTMELIGHPWTLLVLRDLFNGVRRFDELTSHLGIARNVLARRLAGLVDAGLVRKETYRDPGQRARHEYRLTESGRALRPVLLSVMAFGDTYLAGSDGPPMNVEHADCGGAVSVHLRCANGHDLDNNAKLRVRPGPGAALTRTA